ncbi:MAG: lipoprotein insertase outer membrane protein LolB, partial [Enterobacteriaceae bacterium]
MSQLLLVLRRLRLGMPLLLLFLLSACKMLTPTIPPATTTPEWLQHQADVEQIVHYQARGSLLYSAGFKKEYARFFLQQYSAQNYRLLLLSPLGNTELDLRVKDGEVDTVNSKGERYHSDDLDYTLYKLTGMTLPLDSIRLWILGLPGESKQFVLSADNRLRE